MSYEKTKENVTFEKDFEAIYAIRILFQNTLLCKRWSDLKSNHKKFHFLSRHTNKMGKSKSLRHLFGHPRVESLETKRYNSVNTLALLQT